MSAEDGWTSPSDLADYAYCPRSHFYRNHPPPGGPSRASQRSALKGVRYHDRVLVAEQHRDERGAAYWGLLLVGVVLVVLAVGWLLYP